MVLNKFLYRETQPRDPGSYPFHIPFLTEKVYPFCIRVTDGWYHFHIPSLELFIPFSNYCKFTVFKDSLNMKKSQKFTFSRLDQSHKMHLLDL